MDLGLRLLLDVELAGACNAALGVGRRRNYLKRRGGSDEPKNVVGYHVSGIKIQ